MKRGGVTNKERIAHYDTVKAEWDRHRLAIHDMQNNRVVWGAWFSEAADASGYRTGGGKYRAGLSRGEILFIVFRYPGQQDDIQIYPQSHISEFRRLRMVSETWEPVILAINSATAADRGK